MLILDETTKVVIDSSSKGNQRKFYNNGIWIKLNNDKCSEGLAEDFVFMTFLMYNMRVHNLSIGMKFIMVATQEICIIGRILFL